MADTTTLRRWTLDLPDAPYITPNSRVHWSRRARLNRGWRDAAYWLAKSQRIPRCGRVRVSLTFAPGDRRRRDRDNLVSGVLKPCIDGLVDAGVVADDDPAHVEATMPTIVAAGDRRRWLLIVEEVAAGGE